LKALPIWKRPPWFAGIWCASVSSRMLSRALRTALKRANWHFRPLASDNDVLSIGCKLDEIVAGLLRSNTAYLLDFLLQQSVSGLGNPRFRQECSTNPTANLA
jgi:hypothetical protein